MSTEVERTFQECVAKDKEKIDKAHKKERGVILAEKCQFCGEVHPVIRYYWKKEDIDGFPSLRIAILCPSQGFLDKVQRARQVLSEIGIHFDCGYGACFDWEFDWSLKGQHFLFNPEKRKYESIERPATRK